jgi:hypothetical protein
MFSAFVREKSLFRPFVFKMFSALDMLSHGGHKVAIRFGGSKASWWEVTLGRCGIIISFLLRVPGDETKDRVKSFAGALTKPTHSKAGPAPIPTPQEYPTFSQLSSNLLTFIPRVPWRSVNPHFSTVECIVGSGTRSAVRQGRTCRAKPTTAKIILELSSREHNRPFE